MNKILLLICLASWGLALALFWSTTQQCPKTAYLNLAEVYQTFPLQESYARQLLELEQEGRFRMDSLEATSRVLASNEEGLAQLHQKYLFYEQRHQAEKEAFVQQADEKIWRQLHQYLQDFAEQENYDYLLGSTGTGTIISGTKRIDVTAEIIEYVQQRYHGLDQ